MTNTQDAASPAGTPPHSFRASVFSKERTYSLGPDALLWSDAGGGSGRVPYADILRVHIYSMPPTFGQTIRRTILKGRFKGKLMIAATHFLGVGRTEDRAASYLAFVETLLQRVTAANPAVTIVAGHSWPLYIFWVLLFVVSVALLLLAAIGLATGTFAAGAVSPFAILVLLLPVSWRITRRGRPRKADASALYTSDLAR